MNKQIKTVLQNYKTDVAGNFAIIFAASALVLLAGVGVAVDASIAQKNKAHLQDTVEALTLVAAREGITDPVELQRVADQYFSLNFSGAEAVNLEIVSFAKVGDTYTVELGNRITPQFANLLGVNTLDIRASSSVVYGQRNLDLALILDNTGSMRGAKLAALKTASHNLIDILYASPSAQAGTQIGIVPFASWVNVGRSHGNDAWLDQRGTSPQNGTYFDQNVSRFDLFNTLGVSWNGCVENRLPPFDIDDSPADPTNPMTLYQPAFSPDMADNRRNGYNYVADNTRGNFMTRLRNTNKYNGNLPRGVNGPSQMVDSSCSDTRREVTPLTNNVRQLKSRINAMYAQGYTNIANGASWGFRLVSPHVPFTQARTYDTTLNQKAMVILTDGAQTMGGARGIFRSGYSPYGFIGEPTLSGETRRLDGNTPKAVLDSKLAQTCAAAKAKGILVYTITFELNDRPTQNLMRNCASSPQNYFDVATAAELTPAFEQIAASLGELRVAH